MTEPKHPLKISLLHREVADCIAKKEGGKLKWVGTGQCHWEHPAKKETPLSLITLQFAKALPKKFKGAEPELSM